MYNKHLYFKLIQTSLYNSIKIKMFWNHFIAKAFRKKQLFHIPLSEILVKQYTNLLLKIILVDFKRFISWLIKNITKFRKVFIFYNFFNTNSLLVLNKAI